MRCRNRSFSACQALYLSKLRYVLFPRSFERGSIEAIVIPMKLVKLQSKFPRSFERGSIEATILHDVGHKTCSTFPRSFERGSIEARRTRTYPNRCALFPRSFERGSIEAYRHRIRPHLARGFPRSFERGSIEASSGARSCAGGGGFHVHSNVAPLKLLSRAELAQELSTFPRSFERGSIEASLKSPRSFRTPVVSTFIRTWLH